MPVHQKNILRQSFIDAEALEMIRSYHLELGEKYELQERQDDYYFTLITLMNRLFKDLFDESKADIRRETKLRLLEVAKGLLLYSDEKTRDLFQGVNQVNNTLFVATIYYVCQYEAVASVVLKNLKLTDFSTVAGRKIYYIIRLPQLASDEYKAYENELSFVEAYVQSGSDVPIREELSNTEELIKSDDLETVREFFDSKLLCVVLKKFLQHNIWRTLLQYDQRTDWHEYVNYSRTQGILSFLPSQEDALSNGLLTFDRSFSLGMATSAGKTYITELIIYQENKKNSDKKILYLAPLRSLSRELTERYRAIGAKFYFEVRCSYGGHISELEDASFEESKLIIATPEAFVSSGMEYSDFSLVICDEGQLIDDYNRGIEYELLLTRMRQQKHLRFLFLSAIIPNLKNVNEWLGGKEQEIGVSPYRPCRQRLSIAHWNKADGQYYVDVYDRNYENILYTKQIGGVYKKEPKNKEVCIPASLIALQAGPVMVFSSIKTWCDGLVTKMLTHIEKAHAIIKEPNKNVDRIIEYCTYQLGEEHRLVKSLQYGFAYHHAGLPQDIREQVEILLNKSDIPLVFCTSTLAEGVNLPIKTQILCYLQNPIKQDEYLPEAKIKNIVGRVGRAGRTSYGNVVLLSYGPKNKVCMALRGEIGRNIQGTLYDYVHILQLQGKKVENWLDYEELSSSIDSTIAKSTTGAGLEEINIRELIENSFAYTFSTPEEKKNLMSMFEIRYQEMKKYFEHNSYDIYRECGLTISEIERLQAVVTPELIEEFKAYTEEETNAFVSKMIHLVRIVKLADYDESKKKTILTIENVQQVAERWIHERKYCDIAKQLKMKVDDVLFTAMKIVNSYAYKAKSIIIYLQRTYDIHNDKLADLADYLQYGVPNSFMLYLMEKRLSNRTGLYVINDIVQAHAWDEIADHEQKLRMLKANLYEVSKDINQSDAPRLVKIRLMQWITRVRV